MNASLYKTTLTCFDFLLSVSTWGDVPFVSFVRFSAILWKSTQWLIYNLDKNADKSSSIFTWKISNFDFETKNISLYVSRCYRGVTEKWHLTIFCQIYLLKSYQTLPFGLCLFAVNNILRKFITSKNIQNVLKSNLFEIFMISNLLFFIWTISYFIH